MCGFSSFGVSVVCLQRFYEMMKTNGRIVKYIKNVRKPKNDDSFVILARTALSHLQFWHSITAAANHAFQHFTRFRNKRGVTALRAERWDRNNELNSVKRWQSFGWNTQGYSAKRRMVESVFRRKNGLFSAITSENRLITAASWQWL